LGFQTPTEVFNEFVAQARQSNQSRYEM